MLKPTIMDQKVAIGIKLISQNIISCFLLFVAVINPYSQVTVVLHLVMWKCLFATNSCYENNLILAIHNKSNMLIL